MACYTLLSIENDYKVDVCEGKVTVGRGAFLKITDKRVSRNHAVLEVCAGSLTVVPVHTNPIFYRAYGETKYKPLEKDQVKELQNGDCISFLPNDLTFRVERTQGSTSIIANTSLDWVIRHAHDTAGTSDTKDFSVGLGKCKTILEEDHNDHILLDNNTLSDKEYNKKEINKESEDLVVAEKDLVENTKTKLDNGGKKRKEEDVNCKEVADEVDGREMQGTCRPLNKTRVLPRWMKKDKDEATEANAKKAVKVTEVEHKNSFESCDIAIRGGLAESEERAINDDHIMLDRSKETNDLEAVSVDKEQRTLSFEEEDKKRKRGETDVEEEEEVSRKREKKLPLCPYGNRCYRRNPAHFQEYSHDGSGDDSENDDEAKDDLPECPYGEYCYRKNPRHRKEYKHTPQPKTRERRAKRKTVTGKERDDDEDGPNDYDYDDSFIDDESESESNNEASDDSDWKPSGDDDGGGDGGDDDISELLTEARNFTKNKKMLKPT